MGRFNTLLILAAMTPLAGCYEFRDGIDDAAISMKNRTRALRSWVRSEDMFDGVGYKRHFGKGFRDGYFDVAMGGNGCRPTLPPRDYWGSWYQTGRGRDQVKAYFDGHEHGALAAREDGAAAYHSVPTSLSIKRGNRAKETAAEETRLIPTPVEDNPLETVGQAQP